MPDLENDDVLLGELAAALRADVPERVAAAARAAWSWRTIDAELAALTYDSLEDDELAARIRAVAAPRALSFSSEGLDVELSVEDDALLGQLVPPSEGSVEVVTPGGPIVTVPADDLGAFTVRPRPTGPIRLIFTTPAGGRVATDWVPL